MGLHTRQADTLSAISSFRTIPECIKPLKSGAFLFPPRAVCPGLSCKDVGRKVGRNKAKVGVNPALTIAALAEYAMAQIPAADSR